MSTIQEVEKEWYDNEDLMDPYMRLLCGAGAVVFIVFGALCFGAAMVIEAGWVLFASLSFFASFYCVFLLVTDISQHNKLLREALQDSYRANEVIEAELSGAHEMIALLRAQSDERDLDPR